METMHELQLEKGGHHNNTPRPTELALAKRRNIWTLLCYQTISLLAIVYFLWQHGFLTFARQTVCTRADCAFQVTNFPQYVIDYAPLVWLDEGETYFPSDISAQVENTHPDVNFSTIVDAPDPLTLKNLDALNKYGNKGADVFLTSKLDVTTNPTWLEGVVPDSHGKTKGASSCAIIINDRGSGRVDAFYMYFYAYNQGNTVLFHELGDHIGDWEHNMIRFQDGKPETMWFSQHGNGQAFTYGAVEKEDIRPISYSAAGSHANYAIAGSHDHSIPDANLPFGFLIDHTSQGILWDPTLNAYLYVYNGTDRSFSAGGNGTSPVGAMNFKGQWGDQQYPESDPKQGKPFFGFYKYVGGPTGPWNKGLNRNLTCPDNGIPCIIRTIKGP
ncbi:hypothetical protein BP6252_05718 [Coleophoma cylindrospora]|uniref:Vacuolar protein sorting-associated protein 62 n=1 Tax=Coleophoma cylindrospora TaxID=1849047 RepID=A0A3D8RUI1_9HELO|nr:hypothetical protein BP6252_05718 [Coleophoma cylindrospora]